MSTGATHLYFGKHPKLEKYYINKVYFDELSTVNDYDNDFWFSDEDLLNIRKELEKIFSSVEFFDNNLHFLFKEEADEAAFLLHFYNKGFAI